MKVHHIGYFVQEMEKAKALFCSLGYQILQDVQHDDLRKLDICFLDNAGTVVELVSPTGGVYVHW